MDPSHRPRCSLDNGVSGNSDDPITAHAKEHAKSFGNSSVRQHGERRIHTPTRPHKLRSFLGGC